MYHKYRKDEPAVRKALYEAFTHKCFYFGDVIKPKNMHVDHVLASKHAPSNDPAFHQYLDDLNSAGFEYDSLENYVPTCPSCNLTKNNANFNVVNLKYFHGEIKKKVQREINVIKNFKAGDTFSEYCPDFVGWRLLDFKNKHSDFSFALNGYHLSEQDVDVCPKFPQLNMILNKLEKVNYCYIYGSTGCGKSLTLFQAANFYSNNGFLVYLLESVLDDNSCLPFIDGKKVLLVIDDAQRFGDTQFLENKINQCPSDVKILIGITQDDELMYDGVYIPGKDNIKTIYNFYLERIGEVQEIIEKIDTSIGPRPFQTSLEYRLKNALSKASNPWTFNYILRGEWNNVSTIYKDFIKSDSAKELLGIIALLQIYGLDSSSSKSQIDDLLTIIDSKSSEDKDIEWLVKNRFLLSKNEIKIIHLETAKRVFLCFVEWLIKEKNGGNPIKLELILKYLLEKDSFNKGFLWLYDVLFTGSLNLYSLWQSLNDFIFDKDFFASVKEKDNAFRLLSRTLCKNTKSNDIQHYLSNVCFLTEMIEGNNNCFLHGCADLINSLFNYDVEKHSLYYQLVSRLNVKKIVAKMRNYCIDSSLCAFGYLLNRLSIERSFIEGEEIEKAFSDSIEAISEKVNTLNFSYYLYFMSQIYYLNPKMINSFMLKNMTVLIEYSKKEPKIALDLFCLSEVGRFTGMDALEGYKATDEQSAFCKAFLAKFDCSLLETVFKNSSVEESHRMYEFLFALSKYSKTKQLNKLASLVDISTNASTDKLWVRENTELKWLFFIMLSANKTRALKLIESKKSVIQVLSLSIAEPCPELSVELSKNGKKILLFENGWYDLSRKLLTKIVNIDKAQAKIIIEDNLNVLREDYFMMKEGRFASEKQAQELRALCRTIRTYFPDLYDKLEKTIRN